MATLDDPTRSAASIVSELSKMNFSDRMKALVEIGRRSVQVVQLRSTIKEWSEASTFERLLALNTCFGNDTTELPMRALKDASGHVQRRAIKLVNLRCKDEQLVDLAATLPIRLLCILVRRLRRCHRYEVVESIVDHFS